jgi:DNA-binding response OmpR family regulator
MKLLLAHGDEQTRKALAALLRREGYDVLLATGGEAAIARWCAEKPDIVLAEVELPGLNGEAVCRRVRQQALTPVVLLGQRDSEDILVRALESGADDYVSHPNRTRELVARTRAVLRRAHPREQPKGTTAGATAKLVLDPATRTLSQGGRAVRLSPIECRLLQLLLADQGRVVAYEALLSYALGYTDEGSSMLLKSHMYHLRRKTGLSARPEDGLSSVSGVGYRLAEGARLSGRPRAVARSGDLAQRRRP